MDRAGASNRAVPLVRGTSGVTSVQVSHSGEPDQTVLETPVKHWLPQQLGNHLCAPRLKGQGDGNNANDRDNQQPSS